MPSSFYKIVTYLKPDGSLATLSIMMPNDDTRLSGPAAIAYLQPHITPVATIEAVTGLDLFPSATNVGETATLWTFTGRMPTNLCTNS